MTRSPLLIVIAVLALVLAAGALVLQFAMPSKASGASRADVDALRAQVAAIKSSGAGLRVASVNLEEVSAVYMTAVSDLKQSLEDKRTKESAAIQSAYNNGTLTADQFQKQAGALTAELLDAGIFLYASLLDKMIASPQFSDQRTNLQSLRLQVDNVLTASKNLVAIAKGGAVSTTELQNRLTQVQSTFSSLEKLVNTALMAKTMDAVKKVAIQKGFGLVLSEVNVVAYASTDTTTDITDFVKSEVQGYLP
jgi:hypothetical protein